MFLRGLILLVLIFAEAVYGMRFADSAESQSDEIPDTFYDTVPSHRRLRTRDGYNPYPHERQTLNVNIYKDYQKECNSYYGRSICYHVYKNNPVVLPDWWTCWNIAPDNCTEIENLLYLKRQGFKAWDVEIDNEAFLFYKSRSKSIDEMSSNRVYRLNYLNRRLNGENNHNQL
uniref:Chitin-binding type-2 domain-containing protein n=1 Tax=Panagrellus redivivus TaxID=6233 RepID=A0A7E4UVX6_PANRE